ncbi:DUF3017 domain-containing protein [Streptomyces sp. NPDC056796]|uniref:DUF3017 domain-containing protein n=1 Tax=Streptomyces sp. NPDC056796 TaxID=3345947 RepID=UPI0036C17145
MTEASGDAEAPAGAGAPVAVEASAPADPSERVAAEAPVPATVPDASVPAGASALADAPVPGGAPASADASVPAGAPASADASVPDEVSAPGKAAVPDDASARTEDAAEAQAEAVADAETGAGAGPVAAEDGGATRSRSRRFSLTRDTARPEGGGRAAPGDAPAPARQWPLLTVLCTAGLGLLIVGTNPFAEAFRIGAMLMGFALLAGAVLRWVVPSVGMLAVRSRFTDLVTYGLMGALIVLLALMAQPKPWLQVPILQDLVHFTIR